MKNHKFKSILLASLTLIGGCLSPAFLTGCQIGGESQAPLTAQQVTYKSLYGAILAEDQAMKTWAKFHRIREKDNEAIANDNQFLYEANKRNLEKQVADVQLAHAAFVLSVDTAVDQWIKARLAAGASIPSDPRTVAPVTDEVLSAINNLNKVADAQR